MRLITLALLMVFSAGVGWLVWSAQSAARTRDRATQWETHTLQVLLVAQQLLSANQDSETGQRGYLLNGDDTYLMPYRGGHLHASALVAELTRLTADNRRQTANMADLARLNVKRLAELDDSIRLARSDHLGDAIAVVQSGAGRRTMNSIRQVVARVVAEENRLLTLRRAAAIMASTASARYLTLLSGLGSVALIAAAVAFAALLNDRNERRRVWAQSVANNRLRENRDLLQAIIDGSGDPIFVKDLHGRFVLANRRVAEVYGVRSEDMIGRDDTAFVDADTAAALRATDAEIIRAGQARTVEEAVPEQGKIRSFLSAKVPWRVDGKIVGLIGIARDITDRKVMEAQLRLTNIELEERVHTRTAELERALANVKGEMGKRTAAEAQVRHTQTELIHVSRRSAMGTMGSTIAHELNQPLTAITNYVRGSRRLLESGGSIADVRDALAAADQAAVRAGDIMRGVREMVVNGNVDRRPEGLNAIVRDACGIALIDAASTNVSRRLRLDPTLGDVCVDRVQIQQVLLNLLRNSLQAMSDSSFRRIVVSTSRRDRDYCQLTVRDTGPGIPPEIAARLFESFNTSKPDGTGIGLSICRTIIEAHGGKIWTSPIRSGTLFRMTIPYV